VSYMRWNEDCDLARVTAMQRDHPSYKISDPEKCIKYSQVWIVVIIMHIACIPRIFRLCLSWCAQGPRRWLSLSAIILSLLVQTLGGYETRRHITVLIKQLSLVNMHDLPLLALHIENSKTIGNRAQNRVAARSDTREAMIVVLRLDLLHYFIRNLLCMQCPLNKRGKYALLRACLKQVYSSLAFGFRLETYRASNVT
jgi:hypothetical protein